jgi:hypothetical protein
MARYKFKLDNIRITNTRSRHEDTVYVTLGVKTGDQPIQTLQKRLGDLNNGTHNVDLEFDIDVKPGTKTVMSYLIVNSGHSDPSSQLSTISTNLVQKAYNEGGDDGSNTQSENSSWASTVVTVIEEIVKYGLGLFFANCDGWLAGETGLVFTDSNLKQMTDTTNPYRKEVFYPGYDSAHGCGSNSKYYATWEIMALSVEQQISPLISTPSHRGRHRDNR